MAKGPCEWQEAAKFVAVWNTEKVGERLIQMQMFCGWEAFSRPQETSMMEKGKLNRPSDSSSGSLQRRQFWAVYSGESPSGSH